MPEQAQIKEKYPATELFLDMVRAEYNNEDQRKQTIDTKSGILLALATALFPLIITQCSGMKDARSATIVLLVSSIIAGFLGLISLISAVWGYKYDRLNVTIMLDDSLHMMEREDAARALIKVIANKTAYNRGKNNTKVRLYIVGAVLLVVSLSFFSASTITKNIYANYKEEEVMDTDFIMGQGTPTDQAPQATRPATVDEAIALLNTPCYETSELHVRQATPALPVSPAPSISTTPSHEKNEKTDN